MNSVKLYSNGTAVSCRECTFSNEQPYRITIPVRKSDLDDVVSSLTVFGDVTIVSPPTYTPTNAEETELNLDPANVLVELATKLAGATVEVDAGLHYSGRLLGRHTHRKELNGAVVEQGSLLVLTQRGLQQIDESAVTALRFADSSVQAEIDKALTQNLSRIKPDSSLVELTIQPKPGATQAFVTYATPVAAWKIRYQLRLSENSAELEGQAVVDNDTDDDWTQTLITVVTGEPITFSTDLAEIRRPERTRVNVVADRATGAVVAEDVIHEFTDDSGILLSAAAPAGGGYPAAMMRKVARSPVAAPRAEQPAAEVRESGDYSIFESPEPVTIAAKRSAIIPLFNVAVAESRVVLFYRRDRDSARPFRAVRLRNSAAWSLGRGICEIFLSGDFQGKCIMEPTRPGEEVLLIFAKETGVRIHTDVSHPETRWIGIRLSEGVAYCEELRRCQTTYRISNSHAEAFDQEIEHPRLWIGSKLDVSVSAGECSSVDIASGQRIRVSLPAKSALEVTVLEKWIETQSYGLSGSWLKMNLIDVNSPLAAMPEVQECVRLQERVDAIQADLDEKRQTAKTLEEEQKRLLKLIPNAHQEQANEWRTDLANAERELRELKRTELPALSKQLQEAQANLQQSLKRLQSSWKETTQ